jgi:quercetin dioxygenase-like cupin family protein
MRRVVIGTTEDGRSTVVSDGRPKTALHVPPGEAPAVLTDGWTGGELRDGEAVVHQLWSFDATPTPPRVGDTASADVVFDAPVGATKWIITEMGPNLEAPLHKTATVDYAVVVSGDVRIGLETGSVDVAAGDVVLVGGAQHSWHAGPNGCVIATVLVGLSDEYQAENIPGVVPET